MREPQPFSGETYALHCDEYELTMAQSFLHHGQTDDAAFELTVRGLPPQRGYLVAAGLEQALAYLRRLRFAEDDLAFLASTGLYSEDFLGHLRTLRFAGDVDALAEGTVIGAGEPLLRITAPRVQATLVESTLLAIVGHQTLIASKAARVVDAAAGRPVFDFSLRRLHGPDAALGVARAAFIAGAAGTATVVAGARLGIPTTGTMAHHYVVSFGADGEQRGFEQFLRDYPGRAVLLVDTYDTLRGVERAIAASRATGIGLAGIRLDSGDIGALSRAARRLLDDAGMRQAGIVASGDLDEWKISALVESGAPLAAFGVGTMLGTSADAPHLGAIYKLVAQCEQGRMVPVMKTSEDKRGDPGMHQVFRTDAGDVLALATETLPGQPLLQPVIRDGEMFVELPSLERIAVHCRAQRELLPDAVRRIADPEPWEVRRTPALEELRRRVAAGLLRPGVLAG
jgi:nicotinate phosphoribosyltransferase